MADVEARRRARRIVQKRRLVGLANDTKWREFFALLSGAPAPMEVKLIYDSKAYRSQSIWSPVPNYVDGSHIGPELFVFIEWIRSDMVEPLQQAATAVGLECEVNDGKAAVYGYR